MPVKLRHVALVACATALLAMLLVELRLPASRLFGVLEDAAHGPLFGIIACIALSLLRDHRRSTLLRTPVQYLLAAAICLALGLATELAQLLGTRHASFGDFVNDALGTLGGLSVYALFDARVPRSPRALRITLAGVAAGTVLLFTVPILWATAAYAHRNAQFPVLIDGGSRLDLFFLAPLGTTIGRAPAGTVRIEFRAQAWPGVLLVEPRRNWTRFRTLVVDLENPNDAVLPIGLRVHDRAHNSAYSDRFNQEFALAPHTRSALRVSLAAIESAPRGRRLDLQRIAGVAVFRLRSDAPQVLLLHSIRLE